MSPETCVCHHVVVLSLPIPKLGNNIADTDRLIGELKKKLQVDTISLDLDLIKILPDFLRKHEYRVRCILFEDRWRWILVGITAVDDPRPIVGLAIDVGTTRVEIRWIDLITGRIFQETAFDNPQIAIGPDILTRIHFADTPGGLERLHHMIIDGINQEIKYRTQSSGIQVQDIYAISLAGNTTMTHLVMGLNPHWINREPYIPAINSPEIIKASDVGIHVNPSARLLIFPNIGSYFGGDLIAGIFYSGIHKSEIPVMLVDVGTNAEVVLGCKHWMIGCAGAAGPALEGGVSKMGMMASPGAIDSVTINSTGSISFHTIHNEPPKGICGSGMIDLAAQLFLAGMIDFRGKFVPSACKGLLKEIDGIPHLVVVPADISATGYDLTISQAEIDSLIRSKAAMFTILETICMTVGMSLKDLTRFYVAGAFGCYINPKSAITIGMLPDLPLETFKPIGNSSLEGATKSLVCEGCIQEIDSIRNTITYLELNVNQEFMNRFSAAKFLPHTHRELFPSVQGKYLGDMT